MQHRDRMLVETNPFLAVSPTTTWRNKPAQIRQLPDWQKSARIYSHSILNVMQSFCIQPHFLLLYWKLPHQCVFVNKIPLNHCFNNHICSWFAAINLCIKQKSKCMKINKLFQALQLLPFFITRGGQRKTKTTVAVVLRSALEPHVCSHLNVAVTVEFSLLNSSLDSLAHEINLRQYRKEFIWTSPDDRAAV